MTFYQAMQVGANVMKPLIKDTQSKKLKQKYITAFILKNILCLIFCILVVTSFAKVFGNENSIVGVVTILGVLTFRFSNIDFDVKQSSFTLFGVFCIFMVGPYVSNLVGPVLRSIINFIFIMIILILTCHNVMLSNQSILVLSYLLLCGYEVNDINALINRVLGLAIGGIIVASIFYIKQRKVKFENKLSDIIKDVNLSNDRTKWQLKIAFGICTSMLIGELLHLPRTMWIGIACMSIIQPNKEVVEFRFKNRILFTFLGCLLYFIIYSAIPVKFRDLIGMLGGIMVGFSATYQWQVIFNAFGGLTSAIPVLGLEGALIIRLLNGCFGSIYSRVYDKIFDIIHEKITFRNKIEQVTTNGEI